MDYDVVIAGAGPVGLATMLWCKAKGADPVVVSEIAPGRSELALKLGATAVVNPREYNPGARVKELCGKLPEVVKEVFKSYGAARTFERLSALSSNVLAARRCSAV